MQELFQDQMADRFFCPIRHQLPNYVWEAYPSLFILLAAYFEKVRVNATHPARWGWTLSLGVLFLIGLALSVFAGWVVLSHQPHTRYGGSRRALYAGGGGSLRAAPATPRDRGLDGPVRRQRGPCRAAGFCHHASPQCRQAVARHGTTYCCPPRISSKPSWCATKSIVTKRSLCCGSPHARSRWKGLDPVIAPDYHERVAWRWSPPNNRLYRLMTATDPDRKVGRWGVGNHIKGKACSTILSCRVDRS